MMEAALRRFRSTPGSHGLRGTSRVMDLRAPAPDAQTSSRAERRPSQEFSGRSPELIG